MSDRRAFLTWFVAVLGVKGLLAATMEHTLVNPDENRFTEQAREILAGNGFRWEGRPVTSLPVGYPLFLSGLLAVGDEWVVPVQVGMTAAAVAAICAVVGRRSRAWAAVAFLGLAIYPYSTNLALMRMSESLTLALSAGMIVCLDALKCGRRGWGVGYLLGLLQVASLLTAPGMMFVAVLLAPAVAWAYPSRKVVGGVALGVLTGLYPWQVHCWNAIGRVVPTLYTQELWATTQEHFLWYRTWMVSGTDLLTFWDPERLRTANHAFRSTEEKQEVLAALDRVKAGGDVTELQTVLATLGRNRRSQEPVSFFVVKPIVRATRLWLSLGPLQVRSVGTVEYKDAVRWAGRPDGFARPVLAGALVAVHLGLLGAYAIGAYRAVRSRDPVALALVAGVALVTSAAAFSGAIESRRNVPLIPFLVFAPVVGMRATSSVR